MKNQKIKIDIKRIAKLANLSITEKEEIQYEKQLSEIITHIQKLDEVNTSDVPEASNITGLENILREDVMKPSLSQEEALSNVKRKHNGFVVVDRIL